MILLITFLPLLNFVIYVIFGRLINRKYLTFYVISSLVLNIILLFWNAPHILKGETQTICLGNWLTSGLFYLNWAFTVDAITYVMLFVVTSVSSLVHVYSTEYMKDDPHQIRFMSYLSLFTFFMLILITAESFVNLFLGWEGVGLCSYLLISFWFTRIQANKAALKAMIMNRIADLAYVIAIAITFYTFQTTDFNVIFGLVGFLTNSKIYFIGTQVNPTQIITILFFLGAMGKSAQIGLHTWLPDAMEGPTPVSALIHAATMVTAGVFLIIRSSAIFEAIPSTLFFITAIGACTAFLAATAGLVQNDLKKVIAYSTCSQLGYMIFVCGLSQYHLSLFHLTNHAFFKALLFLSAGAVIHGISNEQDLRKKGSLLKIMPFTYSMFVIGSLALMGFPFLTGFYSKDIILENANSNFSFRGQFAYNFGLITAILTAYYSFRLIFLTFYGKNKSYRAYINKVHELPVRMAAPLGFLAVGSIFLGYFMKDLFIGLGSQFWNGIIHFGNSTNHEPLESEFLPIQIKLLPFFGSIGAVIAVFYFNHKIKDFLSSIYLNENLRICYNFLSHKWYFDLVYNRFVNQPLMEGAYRVLFALIDRGVLELFGPAGSSNGTLAIGKYLTWFQTGKVQDYAWLILFFFYLYTITIK